MTGLEWRSGGSGGAAVDEEWRLVMHGEADGATNMAIDEALLREVGAGRSVPTLRFYRWRPATVSIGYFQRAEAQVDVGACRRAGLGLVRRPTGGRALLHRDEVTYSITLPESGSPLPVTVTESYRVLSEGLAAGLAELGIWPELERNPDREAIRPGSGSAACFAAPSWYELTVGGKKLVGSSQVRRHGGLLQHGSIPIRADVRRLVDVLRLQDKDSRARLVDRLSRKSTSIEEAIGTLERGDRQRLAHGDHKGDASGLPSSIEVPNFKTIAAALARGLGARLGVRWKLGELTDRERALADELRRTRYATEEWTLHRPDGSRNAHAAGVGGQHA